MAGERELGAEFRILKQKETFPILLISELFLLLLPYLQGFKTLEVFLKMDFIS